MRAVDGPREYVFTPPSRQAVMTSLGMNNGLLSVYAAGEGQLLARISLGERTPESGGILNTVNNLMAEWKAEAARNSQPVQSYESETNESE